MIIGQELPVHADELMWESVEMFSSPTASRQGAHAYDALSPYLLVVRFTV
jgi:hypothetical protein